MTILERFRYAGWEIEPCHFFREEMLKYKSPRMTEPAYIWLTEREVEKNRESSFQYILDQEHLMVKHRELTIRLKNVEIAIKAMIDLEYTRLNVL